MKKVLTYRYALAVVAVILAFTPYYGFAYIIALWFGAQHIRFSRTFSTLLGRLTLSFLVFTVILMLTGLAAWLVHIRTYPILVVAVFALLLLGFRTALAVDNSSPRILDRGDIVSLILALVAPAIVVTSFYLPHPTAAATYQFLSTGWDNGSHLNMIQNDSKAQGYVYAKNTTLKFRNSIERFDSYPQGWHLANASIVDGFGSKPLDTRRPILAMNVYAVMYLAWFAIAVFCFSRAAWELVDKRSKKRSDTWIYPLLFALPNLLIQLVVLYGSLAHGFANYLGAIAYLSVLVTLMAESDKKTDTEQARFVTALLMAVAITMTWLLPLPALVLMLLLGFNRLVGSILRAPWSALKQDWKLFIFILLTGTAVLVQLMIYESFNVGKVDQLNVGSATGTFPVSLLLVGIVFAIGIVYWIRQRSLNNMFVACVVPISFLALGVYAYQILSIGAPSYYFGKILGLLLVVLGIFFVPAIVNWLISAKTVYELSSLSAVMLAIGMVIILIIGTNQTTLSANFLLQRESKVTYPTAVAVVNYLKSSNPKTTKLVIMRDVKRAEDDNGYLYSLLANIDYTCANYVTGSPVLHVQLHSLVRCSQTLSNDKLVVITSNVTDQPVKNLGLKNVSTVKVP